MVTKPVKVHFQHPKLINKILNLVDSLTLTEIRSYITDQSLLYYYDNFHFEQKGKKLN